ncbi:GNAT family N-acetyltransferase, partial [Mycobacterium tuberculosis]|nr:GNAT family N-acetyltransferase [Mycobacterium tuberculosis]
YTRLSWAVLNWNTDAITLYDGIGGEPQNEWTTYRLSGSQLAWLAESP